MGWLNLADLERSRTINWVHLRTHESYEGDDLADELVQWCNVQERRVALQVKIDER
eukprot:SAG31_NODE_1795_length_7248_cov_682.054833_3_plen_56_part_00